LVLERLYCPGLASNPFWFIESVQLWLDVGGTSPRL